MVTALIIFFLVITLGIDFAWYYFRRLSRKRGEPYFPKYAKYFYITLAVGTCIGLLGIYIFSRIAGVASPF